MRLIRRAYRIIDPVLIMIWVNVLIPKAGIKMSGIPLTLGNVLLAFCIIRFIIQRKGRIIADQYCIAILVSVFFWAIRVLIPICLGAENIKEYIGQLVALVFYPLTYFVAIDYFKRDGTDKIEKAIKTGLFIVMLYGLAQFIMGIGRIDVPGITVNYSDYINNPNDWWTEKFNTFGDSTKIVSTYQNGNVLGCSLLLLFPVAYRSKYRKEIYRYCMLGLFLIVLVLTGSRSCLIGAGLYLMTLIIQSCMKTKKSRQIFSYILLFVIAGIPVVYKVLSSPRNAELMDRMFRTGIEVFIQGSGRTNNAIEYFNWLSGNIWALALGGLGFKFSGYAYEMTYILVLIMGGLVGLFIFIFPFQSIIMTCRKVYRKTGNTLLHGTAEGLIIYFVTAFLEGAYWLPPTGINLWMVCALGIYLSKHRIYREDARSELRILNT